MAYETDPARLARQSTQRAANATRVALQHILRADFRNDTHGEAFTALRDAQRELQRALDAMPPTTPAA
jgi:hypothetical protein